jgi:hypothetical protein
MDCEVLYLEHLPGTWQDSGAAGVMGAPQRIHGGISVNGLSSSLDLLHVSNATNLYGRMGARSVMQRSCRDFVVFHCVMKHAC